MYYICIYEFKYIHIFVYGGWGGCMLPCPPPRFKVGENFLPQPCRILLPISILMDTCPCCHP